MNQGDYEFVPPEVTRDGGWSQLAEGDYDVVEPNYDQVEPIDDAYAALPIADGGPRALQCTPHNKILDSVTCTIIHTHAQHTNTITKQQTKQCGCVSLTFASFVVCVGAAFN